MARFTMCLMDLVNKLAEHGEPFWTYSLGLAPEHETEFKRLFLDYYAFHEIGFETPAMFRHQLKCRLELIAPRYKKLYETTLKEIDMVNNYDMTETSERVTSGTLDTSNTVTGKNSSVYMDTPQGRFTIGDGYATNVTEDTANSSTTGGVENKGTDKHTLTRKGNIGVTTASDMIQKYRDILIDINKDMIEECYDLFMGLL